LRRGRIGVAGSNHQRGDGVTTAVHQKGISWVERATPPLVVEETKGVDGEIVEDETIVRRGYAAIGRREGW
jgi:hypothetical protein